MVVAFFLCWAPFHAQRLLTVYGSSTEDNTPKSNTFYVIYVVLTHVSGVTFFLSTCINPLLYSVMSYKFRSAFKVGWRLGEGRRRRSVYENIILHSSCRRQSAPRVSSSTGRSGGVQEPLEEDRPRLRQRPLHSSDSPMRPEGTSS